MKLKIQIFFRRGALMVVPLFLFSGCSYVGLYSEEQVKEINEQYRERGFNQGRAHEIRGVEHGHQSEAANKQVREEFYSVWVPPHVNEKGVKVEGHYLPISILVEK